jgi:CheY-like chemotaxis protein
MKKGRYALLVVSDTGIGMDEATRERVFEPFFTTKETGKGTGLGLSTSISIVKGHGGFVHLYSEEGRGTTFKVHLPAITAAAVRDAEPKPAPPLGSGELLLVVDDEAAIRELTKETLESHGYRVLTAADGAEAVAVFAREHGSVDAVVTDMSMPLMDGPSAIRALRKMDPKLKLITMSGLVPGVAESAQAEDVDAHLLKPFTADALLTTLRAVLRGTREV